MAEWSGEDMRDEAAYKVGLRVGDVLAAVDFYAGLGFDRVAELTDLAGRPVMAILRRGALQLLVDDLTGMPFADSERERQTLAGPRGLGVVMGILVDDVDRTADYCERSGCEVTAAPQESPWGERYAECVDPYGYAWKLFRPSSDQAGDGLAATRATWFGTTGD